MTEKIAIKWLKQALHDIDMAEAIPYEEYKENLKGGCEDLLEKNNA